MIISYKDMQDRLGDKRNSLKDRNLAKTVKKEGRTEEDLDRNDKPSGPDLFIRDATKGKREGDSDTPQELRIPAMVLARLAGGTQEEIGETLGISQGQVSNFNTGKSSTPEEEEKVTGALSIIREAVINKIDESIGYLTPDKLINAKAGELAGVISKLAQVSEITSPVKKDNAVSNIKVVIHAVGRQEINRYDVIEVGGS